MATFLFRLGYYAARDLWRDCEVFTTYNCPEDFPGKKQMRRFPVVRVLNKVTPKPLKLPRPKF